MLRWTTHLEGGPRRVNHAAVAVGHKVYSFGGYCSGEDYETLRQIDVHIFNLVSMRWSKLPPVIGPKQMPYMRYGHTAVLVEDAIYVWGGRNDTDGACNVLYSFDIYTHRWLRPHVSGPVPGARDGHSAAALRKCMYIFGGYEQLADCFSNDVHKMDTTTMTWTLIHALGGLPRWRDFHSATFIGQKMYVFGGRADMLGPSHSNREIYCNRIKVFDTEKRYWFDPPVNGTPPDGRRSHSAFAYKGELYIFGGYNALVDRHFDDLWKFSPETMTWQRMEVREKGPCPRRRQCCCLIGDQAILFGGTRYPNVTIIRWVTALCDPPPIFTDGYVCPCPEQGMGDEFNLMDHSDLYILDFAPSLKTLCTLAVVQYKLDLSNLPHDIRWEITAMTTNSNISRPIFSSHG